MLTSFLNFTIFAEKSHDVLLEINGDKVATWTQARIKIATVKSGSTLKFKVKDANGYFIKIRLKIFHGFSTNHKKICQVLECFHYFSSSQLKTKCYYFC